MFTLQTIQNAFDCSRTCKDGHWCRFTPLFKRAGITTRVHSHVAKIDCTITDLDMLERACRACGLELIRGQTEYRWFGHSVGDFPIPSDMTEADLGKCSHAIRIPRTGEYYHNALTKYGGHAYEIGVVERKDGNGFALVWDFYCEGMGIEPLAGANCSKLVEAYQFGVVEQAAKELGWQSERTQAGLVVYSPAGGTVTVTPSGTVETAGFVGNACHEARTQLGIMVDENSIQATVEGACAVATVGLPG